MKVLALVAVTLVSQALGGVLFKDEWQKFKATYNKNYGKAEEIRRKEVFMKNLEKIRNHNSSVVGYTVGVNKFADMSPEEFTATMTGLEIDVMELLKATVREITFEELPKSFDWRKKGAVTPVKDQGRCKSCWAFSATGALEGAYQIKHKKLPSFSEQELVDCRIKSGCQKGGCAAAAFSYIMENGIESEDDYPYTAGNDSCHLEKSKMITKLKSYAVVKSEEALQQAVFKQPVSVGVDSTPLSFYTGKPIKAEGCKKKADHAALIVGWDTFEDGTPYWILKNSWGKDWGKDGGYFKIVRGKNACSLLEAAIYPVL